MPMDPYPFFHEHTALVIHISSHTSFRIMYGVLGRKDAIYPSIRSCFIDIYFTYMNMINLGGLSTGSPRNMVNDGIHDTLTYLHTYYCLSYGALMSHIQACTDKTLSVDHVQRWLCTASIMYRIIASRRGDGNNLTWYLKCTVVAFRSKKTRRTILP